MSRHPSQAAYAINGVLSSSDAFYAVACDPRRSVAVEACAGAGKTWMLIERIVRAMSAGDTSPEQILAITFTRKAAAEMRERLQQKLREPAHKALLDAVLASGHSVQILTFHAWFAQLLKAAPMATLQQLGLPLQYELLESEDALLPDLKLAFYGKVLADNALQADLKALLSTHGRHQTEQALAHLLDKRAEFELTDARGLLEDSVQTAREIYPDYADALEVNTDAAWLMAKPAEHAQLGLLAKALGQHHTSTIQTWATNLERGLTEGDFALVCTALLTQKMEARKLGKMKLADGDSLLLRGQAYVLEIVAAQHQHACWLYQQRMSRLGRAWLAEFAALKRSRGLVDMPDLERAATTLLSNAELSGAIQERLDARLRHVMIDEFQDTNPLQWQAMHAWLASYAGSSNRPSLFIVGDPKQSIYRFRRAEPRVFAAAQAFMRQSFEASLLACDHTRRNSAAVLDVVNAAMLTAQQVNEYAGFRAHTTETLALGEALALPLIERKPPTSVRPELVEGRSVTQDFDKLNPNGDSWRDSLTTKREDAEESIKEQEADQAARYIASLRFGEGGDASSIMVLSRTHAPLALIQQALQRYGIATDKQERSFLADSPAAKDVIALLNALVSPQNDLDLAIALKSPLFGWTDAQLMAIRVQQLQALTPVHWFDVLEGDIKAQLLHWQSWLHTLPPHDALQAIYDDGDVLNKYLAVTPHGISHASQLALKALLWAALQVEGGRYLSAYAFVRALKASVQTIKAPTLNAASKEAVQLLTVHGAKGLEADVVLLLDSDPQAKNAQSMTTLIDWSPEQSAPRKFVFLQSESGPPLCAEDLLETDFKARAIEELNTLYVAMTRARQTLVLSASQAKNQNPSSVWSRLESLCGVVLVPPVIPASTVIPAQAGIQTFPSVSASSYAAPVNRLDSRLRGNDGGANQAGDALDASARIGSAMHRLLQWQAWGAVQIAAVAKVFDLTQLQANSAAQLASTMASGEAAWIWDAAQIDWQANEYELPDPNASGRWLRIDRLVKCKDTQVWWVVDFKSALAPEKSSQLRDQLTLYRQAVMQALNAPFDRVRSAFVTGSGQWIESV